VGIAAPVIAVIMACQAVAEQPPILPNPPAAAPDQVAEPPRLIFSPWTKFCPKDRDASAKQMCFTGKDGRAESGTPVVGAVLIEPDGDPKKVLRVTLPLGMSIQPGTRVIVDNGEPMTAPYVMCLNSGCMADYEASDALIGRLKKGQRLAIQGINGAGQPISLVVPLNDFGKAYDGPPTDPKVFEEQQRMLRRQQPVLDDRLLPSTFEQQKRLHEELLRRRHDDRPRPPRFGAVN
jgi:invasion protein IalB